MEKKAFFRKKYGWVILFLLPQLVLIVTFSIVPMIKTFWDSFQMSDPFGGGQFVGLQNYFDLFSIPENGYIYSLGFSIFFSLIVTGTSMLVALLLAVASNNIGNKYVSFITKLIILVPYAISPAASGVIWMFVFNPANGIVKWLLGYINVVWSPIESSGQAIFLVIFISSWKKISYNFIFYLAALSSIPQSLIEASKIDSATPTKRFFTIILPLLSPISFFLLIINLISAFTDTFAEIDLTTQGGPGISTKTLVYKIFQDGFKGMDIGGSTAQSIILFILVGILTILQFKYVNKKVSY